MPLLAAVFLSAPAAADPLVLTGALRAAEAEYFAVPATESWQVQLQWLVEEGSRVESGQSIARLDPGSLLDELEQARTTLDDKLKEQELGRTDDRLRRLELDLALVRTRAEYEKARLEAAVPEEVLGGKDHRERLLALRETADALAAAERDVESHELGAEAERETEAIELAQLRDEIARYETQLEALDCRATREGIVVHGEHPWFGRKFRQGDQVETGFVLASIPDLDSLEVLAWAMEPELPALAVGQRAHLRLDAYPSRAFHGVVTSVGVAGQKRPQWGESPFFAVRIRIEDPDRAVMRPGMSVRCEIELALAGDDS
jgi:multidrug resistance efflux pump